MANAFVLDDVESMVLIFLKKLKAGFYKLI